MWRATFKALLAKKLRFALTALSVVLGVGFVAGTFVLTDTMNAAFDQLFSDAAGTSDVIVRAESAFTTEQAGPGGGASADREPIPASVLPLVKSVTGVALVGGDVQGTAQMVDPVTDEPIGGFGPPTIGSNWNDVSSGTVSVSQGEQPTGPDEVAIDAATANKHDLAVGEQIQILFAEGTGEFTISGLLKFGDADNLAGATLAIFDTTTAQKVLGKEGVYDTISVVGDDSVSASELRADIQSVLPDGVEAVTSATVADEQSKALKEGLGFFRTALLVFAFIALFVGAFIIFNTFSIIVAQRTRELALLRALGASRRQVMTSVVVEAFLVGLFAAVVGIVAGIGIAAGLKVLLGAFGIDLPSTSLQLLPRTIIVSLLIGAIVTVVASFLPARKAARVAPIQALRESGDTAPSSATTRRRLIVGIVVTALGGAALLYGLFGATSNEGALVGLGAAVIFVGVAMLSPLFARPIAGGLGAPLRRLSISGKLGRENAVRSPRRTASTAAALMIGLGLVSMVAILSASLKASFDQALTETLRADYMLSTSTFTSFGAEAANLVRDLPEVEAITEFRQNGFRIDGTTAFVTGVQPDTLDVTASIDVTEGSLADLAQPDTIMVYEEVAKDNGWAVGDTVPAQFATVGDAPLTLVGIYGDNRLAGDYLISLDTYDTYFTEPLDSFVLVKASPDVPLADAQAAIEAAVKGLPNIQVQDQAAFREQQAGFIDQLLGLVTALLFMSILIAVFGIVNTLGLSIYERTRELGLLRAVGMSRRQVKRMIRWEAVIIAIFGASLGIVIGILFGWALQQALANQGVTQLKIPVGQLVFYLVFAGLIGVLAAIWPARRAAKLNVLEAISYE
jgi:putative ABC transport system permease protein